MGAWKKLAMNKAHPSATRTRREKRQEYFEFPDRSNIVSLDSHRKYQCPQIKT